MKDLKKKALWGAIFSVGVASLYLIIALSLWVVYRDRAYLGTRIAGINVSGKNKTEIENILNEAVSAYRKEKLSIISTKPTEINSKDLGLVFDVSGTAEDILRESGRNPFVFGLNNSFSISAKFSEDEIYSIIDEQSKKISTIANNPEIVSSNDGLSIAFGDPGKRVNFAETAHRVKEAAENLKKEIVVCEYSLKESNPGFMDSDMEGEILRKTKSGLTVVSPEKKYFIDQSKLLSWINIGTNQSSGAMLYGGDEFMFPGATSSGAIFSSYKIMTSISLYSADINRSPQNAKLSSSGGKVVVAIPDKVGQRLDPEKSASVISEALDSGKVSADLVVDQVMAEIRADNLAELGLTELVSEGYSNFSGSPTNRRHNIKTGASKFNGYLIRPDETFSFITVLGPVDASTGYLPELVIKENKTVPEYGGGMCQVSSTAFRAALNAGLPIIERTAHSYPVSYYKPYGVDATVYIPKPDLIFKNDTGKYIMIQTSIDGNNLFFDFYGTKPTRTVKFSGNEKGDGGVAIVEKVSPLIYDQEARGRASFTAVFWRHIYDAAGKLISTSKFLSKYDSPDKYPH